MIENGKNSTRLNQQPDWLVAGLLKAALFPEQAPDQPMFNTGVTFAQLKDQVKAILMRSGLDLTAREVSSGTHWLTHRIANNVSESDTKETLIETLNKFVAQYVVDKAVQRQSGVGERSPIYDRAWYDKNFTPPTDREAAGIGHADDHEPQPEKTMEQLVEPQDMVYVGMDGDDMGHLVEDSLLSDDPEIAAKISNSIHDAHRAIRKLVSSAGGRLIFDGGDNMLFFMANDPEVFKTISEIHERVTKHTVTIGVGHRPIEAHYALVVGKNTGKNQVVIFDEKVKAQHESISRDQDEIEQKLKYRASALDAVNQETNYADRLHDALSSAGMDSGDRAVRDLFWRLVQQFDLNDMRAISLFFAAADDHDLLSAVRQTYAKRWSWALRLAGPRELTKVEAQAVLHDLVRAIEAGKGLDEKFQALLKETDNQALRDLDEAGEIVDKRFVKVSEEFAEMMDEGKTLRHSHYVQELHQIAAEITSMAIPLDQALTVALQAVVNAKEGLNESIEIGQVVTLATKWIDRVNAAAMALDLVCVVSGARPMKLASAPTNFPGQTNVVRPSGQQSPHARHDWLSVEDYNEGKVDFRKTDDQAGLALPGEFAERSVGGDAGGSPIYVP